MRRLLVLCLAALLPAALILGAPAGAKTIVPPTPKLRGAQSIAPAKPAPAKATGGAAPITLWTAAGTDAAACRRACAQTRYFCEAGASADDCASTWGQCSAACSSPNLAVGGLRGATE